MRIDFEKLGAEMLKRKARLQADGVPPAQKTSYREHPKSDSPAAASARRRRRGLFINGHRSAPKRGRSATKKH